MTEPLDTEFVAALHRIARVDRLLIALDFDGTLAPEVDVPDEARALPAAIAHLTSLQRMPGTTIAFVSGRALSSLDVVTPPEIAAAMIGSHGLEVRIAPGDEVAPIDERDSARVGVLRAAVQPLVDAVEGAWVEVKPAGFAVHTRLVEARAAEDLQGRVRAAAVDADAEVLVRDGKNVVEFAVRDATKGDGVRVLRDRLQPNAVLFAGDDVTDEDALAVLEQSDVGIKVGTADTVAPFRVADPHALVEVLAHLVEQRSRA